MLRLTVTIIEVRGVRMVFCKAVWLINKISKAR